MVNVSSLKISQDDVSTNAKPEVTVLEDLTAHHRNLLKHPLLRAFLMLKWRKINNIYKAWIAVKAIFLCLLLAAVARNFRTSDKTDKNEERLSNVTGTGNDNVVALKGWGLSAKLGKHSAIWGKLGAVPQAYTLNPCTKFPPNPTSRKVNT